MRVLFFISAVDFILSALAYLYYRHNFAFARTMPFIIVYLILAANTVLSRVLPEFLPLPLLKLSSWLSGLWIAFLYYSILLSVLHGVCYIISRLVHFNLPAERFTAAGLVFIVCFIAWGSYRAFHPTIRTENIVTSKLNAGEHYKIVLLSDLHLGRILGNEYAKELVQRVNAEKPDLILIAGDIMDESIAYIQHEDSLSPLAGFKAPKGVYVAFGNHDYLDNPVQWRQMLINNGMTVLQDDSFILDNKLKITGLHDYSHNRDNRSLIEQSAGNSDYYSIVIDHQPRKIDPAAENGYDLYVAGHTHTGQLFPNRQVTKRMYKLDYGRAEFNGLTAITSNGYGFWGPPVRTEVAPEFIVIELSGK